MLILLLIGGCTLVFPIGQPALKLREVTAQHGSKDKIAIIPINGIIQSGESNGLLAKSSSPIALFASRLQLAKEDERVKAVLVTINSPGGSVAASDLLYHQLVSFREQSGKPVIAQILDLGTSGGYYSALAANAIYALPTSITCSIGVIVIQVNAEQLLHNNGLAMQVYSSGESKDAGAPYKASSPADKKIFNALVDNLSDRFFRLVKKHRALDQADAPVWQQGAICTADAALEQGLIDAIHYPEQTIRRIVTDWQLTADPTLVSYEQGRQNNPGLYQVISQAQSTRLNPLPESFTRRLTPGVYYLGKL